MPRGPAVLGGVCGSSYQYLPSCGFALPGDEEEEGKMLVYHHPGWCTEEEQGESEMKWPWVTMKSWGCCKELNPPFNPRLHPRSYPQSSGLNHTNPAVGPDFFYSLISSCC